MDLRLLADDLTGALDSAAAFAPPVPVHLDRAPQPCPAGVVALSLATRDIAPALLPAALAGLGGWLAAGSIAFKKVDSLLRGNTFAECAQLLRDGGFAGMVFAPAFPSQRRITTGGCQRVVDADDAARATPVGEPIADAFARLGVPLLAEPGARPLSRDGVTAGAAAPVAGAAAPVAGVWIPEVRDDADLHSIARRADPSAPDHLANWLWCGSAGLAQALAALPALAAANAAQAEAATAARPTAAAPRRVLMLGASHHAVVRRQWALLREARPSAVLMREGDAAALAAAGSTLAADWDVAALELSPLRPLSADEAAALLRAQLDELVGRIARPATLLVIGGDSLLALCRATGVSSLRTAPPLRAGWGSAVLVGGLWDGLRCHARSGAFGDDADLLQMLDQVARAG